MHRQKIRWQYFNFNILPLLIYKVSKMNESWLHTKSEMRVGLLPVDQNGELKLSFIRHFYFWLNAGCTLRSVTSSTDLDWTVSF